MRVWTKSACVVLAWSVLLIVMVAAGMSRSHPAQAETRIASSTTGITLADTVSVAAVSVRAVSPAARYVVQPGDTLSGIAARLAVRGGWAALYAANRPLIGPDPDVIRPGTVLVLPGGRARPGTWWRRGTPCPRSRLRWRCAAAGRRCTRRTGGSSALTRG